MKLRVLRAANEADALVSLDDVSGWCPLAEWLSLVLTFTFAIHSALPLLILVLLPF
jgi:hypothetical protein